MVKHKLAAHTRPTKPAFTTHRTILAVLVYASGINPKIIAERIGIHPAYFSAISTGSERPSDATLSRLAMSSLSGVHPRDF